MPDRFWVSGGNGSYNSTTNWSATSGGASGASVPTSVDNVFFNASSGSGTVTITPSSNCANLVLTGFTGTLALTNNFLVNGTVLNLGTGGYTVSGVNNLVLVTSMTATSNGTTFTGNLNVAGNITLTLADNFTLSGNLTFSQTGACTINGNTFNVGSNLSVTASGNVSGSTLIVFNGTGTWSHTGSGVLRNNVTINTAGTITIGTNIRYGVGILTYTAGTVVTTGSTLNIVSATTLTTNGITWNNISTPSGGLTIALGSNLTLTGVLTLSSTTLSFTLFGFNLISTNANLTLISASFILPANQTFKTLTVTSSSTISSNTLTITENLVINGQLTGTSSIVYGGTGTWTALDSTATILNNFTINTLGTLTISGTVYKGSNTITYTAGTVNDTGATIIIGTTLNTTCNISGKTWARLLVNGDITLLSNINATTFGTTGSNNISFTLGGNSLVLTNLELGSTATTTLSSSLSCQNLEINNPSTATINGNSITINGNILQSNVGVTTGTTTFVYAGTGTWTRTNTGYFSNNFTINTLGTLTLTGANIGGGVFTYTAGTVITSGGTLWNRVSGTTFNHGGLVFNNVIFGASEGSGSVSSVTLNNLLRCTGTLTLGISDTTFAGTDGTFDVNNLVLGTDLSGLKTTTLISTRTYRVRQSFSSLQANNSNKILIRSSVGGSRAIFTLDSGGTFNVGYVNATDLNSSLGITIYSFNGVITNSLNWRVLPNNPTPASSVFVN